VCALHTSHGTTPDGGPLTARCTLIEHRSRRCLLVVLQPDLERDAVGRAADPECAAFTLDAVGRVDSWGRGAQEWTGFPPEHVIGSDTTLLHPGPARLAGEPHRALTQAYRTGEYRSEGWRVCSGGRNVWAQVTTCALYDARERLVGFATVMQDLTARRRLTPAVPVRLPAPRPPLATRPMRPAPARPRAGTRPGRVPGQRRPSGS
jgi:PAS domain S-box-containing protein